MGIVSAAAAGQFSIGGDLLINRLGFGSARITGKGVWGEPTDRDGIIAMLKRLPALGVNFIDTAEAYGPEVSEQLIREALHPYPSDMIIATKGGLARPGADNPVPLGRPEYLRQGGELSRRRLGVEQIDLWQLHRIDPKVPRDEQFGAIREMLNDGLIRHAGLSEVSVEEIEAAQKVFPVASVQNLFNLSERKNEEVLDYCTANNIAFIPFLPLASGKLAKTGALLSTIATAHEATPSQIALAWILKRSPVMVPIPGTSKIAHLEENIGAASILLSAEEFSALDEAGRSASEL